MGARHAEDFLKMLVEYVKNGMGCAPQEKE